MDRRGIRVPGGRAVRLTLAMFLGAIGSLGLPPIDVTAVGRETFVSRDAVRTHVWRHGGMHPALLNKLAAKHRRSAQGKPSKRYRGVHA